MYCIIRRTKHHRGGDPNKKSILNVQSYTPATLGKMANIPKKFAVLTVDAEGVDLVVLRAFIAAGFRPLFAIVEIKRDADDKDVSFLTSAGYKEFAHVGSNFVFELA